MTDLTKITTPYGLLDDKTKAALKAHGGPYEHWGTFSAQWKISALPGWSPGIIYRVAHDRDTINWDHVADQFICMARDNNGKVYAYTDKPNRDDKVWTEPDDLDSFAGVDILASYKRGTCDWKDSLVFRPGHEPKGEHNDD